MDAIRILISILFVAILVYLLFILPFISEKSQKKKEQKQCKTLFGWYLKCFRQWTDFKGRARRKEYWSFRLLSILFYFSLFFCYFLLEDIRGRSISDYTLLVSICLFGIRALLIPALSVTVRRLHDIGQGGWWLLLLLIPYVNCVGAMIIFVMSLFDSQKGSNNWGTNPKDELY